MITIFNRRELTMTYDMQQQARVCDVLAANGVDYLVKTCNRMASLHFGGSGRAHYGSFGVNKALTYEYRIYVHKNDLDKALHLIRR